MISPIRPLIISFLLSILLSTMGWSAASEREDDALASKDSVGIHKEAPSSLLASPRHRRHFPPGLLRPLPIKSSTFGKGAPQTSEHQKKSHRQSLADAGYMAVNRRLNTTDNVQQMKANMANNERFFRIVAFIAQNRTLKTDDTAHSMQQVVGKAKRHLTQHEAPKNKAPTDPPPAYEAHRKAYQRSLISRNNHVMRGKNISLHHPKKSWREKTRIRPNAAPLKTRQQPSTH